MFTRIRHILEMIRFSHTLFALPFALLAAMMAWRVGGQALSKWALVVGESIKQKHDLPNSMDTFAAWDNEIRSLGLDKRNPLITFRSSRNDSFSWEQLAGILLCMIFG